MVAATLFDSSAWIALAFPTHPAHHAVNSRFDAADSNHPVAFCRATQQSFLRLVTTEKIQKLYGSEPIDNRLAWLKWELLFGLPQVGWLDEGPGLADLWKAMAATHTASPKLWMDAYLAAVALSNRVPLAGLDSSFHQFEDLEFQRIIPDRD